MSRTWPQFLVRLQPQIGYLAEVKSRLCAYARESSTTCEYEGEWQWTFQQHARNLLSSCHISMHARTSRDWRDKFIFLDCVTHVSHISEVRGLYIWSSWLIRFVIHSECVRVVETAIATRPRTLMLTKSLRILKSLIFFDNGIPWHMSHDRDPWVLLLPQFWIVINLCYKNNKTTSKGGLEINNVLGSFTTRLFRLSKYFLYPYIHMQTEGGRERWRVCV